ncbi:MAG: FtsQ-type POTRA domain-containing protein [Deltaproteobacteria bacterium]|nr:FtsQ-type POTRA domain-containing protein [Deltaproteobacteria bacterium]
MSRRSKRIFKGIAAVIVVIAISFSGKRFYEELLNSPLLRIKEIDIQGVKRISRDEILELAGIRIGDNILAASIDDMAVNIRKHPWINTLKIKRRMPDKLVVEIKERVPAAFINMDELYLIDESGSVFKRASLEDDLDLPVINAGISKDGVEDNEKVSSLIIDAVLLIKLLDDREIFGTDDISEIKVDPVYGLTLYTMDSGVRVEMGFDNFQKKLERLDRVLKELNGTIKYVKTVDMNYGKRVVVKMANS